MLVVGGGYGVGGWWQKATGVTTLPRKHLFTTGKLLVCMVHEVVVPANTKLKHVLVLGWIESLRIQID